MPVDYAAVVEAFVRSEETGFDDSFRKEGRWDARMFGSRPGKFIGMTRNCACRKCVTLTTA